MSGCCCQDWKFVEGVVKGVVKGGECASEWLLKGHACNLPNSAVNLKFTSGKSRAKKR